jgi:preprotein translocase subunit SecE
MSDIVKTAKLRKTPNIGKYLIEIKNELKRVVWPTWKQVVSNTITVLIMCLIFGLIIWAADFLFIYIAQYIYQVTGLV